MPRSYIVSDDRCLCHMCISTQHYILFQGQKQKQGPPFSPVLTNWVICGLEPCRSLNPPKHMNTLYVACLFVWSAECRFLSEAFTPPSIHTQTHGTTPSHPHPCQPAVKHLCSEWVLTATRPLAEHPGNDGHPDGGGQSRASRRGHPGQPGGSPELPAALESPQRLRLAERHRPASLPTAGAYPFIQSSLKIDSFVIVIITIGSLLTSHQQFH